MLKSISIVMLLAILLGAGCAEEHQDSPQPLAPAMSIAEADYVKNEMLSKMPAVDPASYQYIVYPEAAKKDGLSGKTFVQVLVNPEGRVELAEIANGSGSELLDQDALEGVRQFTFTPGEKDGQAVATVVMLPVAFKLN